MPLESFHTTPPDASFTGTGSAAWVAAHNLRMEGGGFLVGRETAGTGAPESIAVGANLTLSGGTLSAAGGTGAAGVSLVEGVAPILVTGTATSTVALATSGVIAGTYGGALIIPRFDISAQGIVLSGTNVGTLGTFAGFNSLVAAGDVLGTSPTNTLTAALSTTGVTAGTYGNGTSVGQFVVDAKGRISLATNVPVSGLAVPYIIQKSGVSVTAPADTNNNIVLTVPVAAGAMGANGALRLFFRGTNSSNANVKTVRIYIGASGAGTGGTLIGTLTVTNSSLTNGWVLVSNSNDVAAQQTTVIGGTNLTLLNSLVTATINTASAWEIVVAFQKATGTDTMTLNQSVTELLSDGT